MKKNICNQKDHELWDRRSFLKGIGLSGIGAMLFANANISFATNTELTAAINAVDNDNVLLIIKLFGGNDGLNMIVPVNQYDEYANYRPNIKIPESDLLSLSDEYAMPNFMDPLEPMWKEGKMKIVHSVGYENQSKSHFKGSDLWASGEIEATIQETGWLGRYFDNRYEDYLINPPASPVAIEIGSTRNITFDGEENKYSYAVANVSSLQIIAETGKAYASDKIPDCEYGDQVSFLRSSYNNSYAYAGKIHDAYNASSDYTGGTGSYPATTDAFGNLGDSLNLIARLIKGNLGTKIYMVTLSGFDTHSAQYNTHQSLLTNLSECVSYFHEDLTDAGWGDKIVTMTQSEFGRRVTENGSKGTDHGTAGPIMLFGEGLNGSGFVGEHADLNDLDANNLKHHTDFRQLYASLLKDWMSVDANLVDTLVLGSEFDTLDLGLQSEAPIDVVDVNLNSLTTYASYDNNDTVIYLESGVSQNVTVSIYSLSGQKLDIVENNMLLESKAQISLGQKLPGLPSGIYIYRVDSNSRPITKKIIVR